MTTVDLIPPHNQKRRGLHRRAALAGAAVALLPGAAFAQEASASPDRDWVMIWTTVVSVLALLACAVGYAWRRMQGMDHPTPDELEMMGNGHGGDAEHAAVHPHAESEHGAAAAHH